MKKIKTIKLIAMVVVGIILNGCSQSMKIEQYNSETPVADVKSYFNGPIKAWGLIQDRKGRVVTRFDVHMVGRWEGDSGVLEESFEYYDGKKQERIWRIQKLGPDRYEGQADDIIGMAKGEQSGNAIRWSYVMDIDVDGKVYRITFDDWMLMMNDGVLINRSYLKKFGFTVAELTLFMQKDAS